MNTNKKCKAMLFSLVRELLEVEGDALNDLSWQGGMEFPVKLSTMYRPNDGQALIVGISIKSICAWGWNILGGDAEMVD